MRCWTKFWSDKIPATVFWKQGVWSTSCRSAWRSGLLNAEMDHHLVAEAEGEAGNQRNNYGSKTVLTDTASWS